MRMNVLFSENNMNAVAEFSEDNHTFDTDVGEVAVINEGQDGATFIPSVSADGVLSWTNDGKLPNPVPVNIKGDKGDKGDPGKDGVDGLPWVDLGTVDDVIAEMDNLLEDGHYRLWTDDPFCYSLTVERVGDHVGQTYWSTEEGRGMLYFRSALFNGEEWEWLDDWIPHVTQDWLDQYAFKNHKHRQSMNADFATWINTFREGQYQIHVQAESKSYIVDQYVFNNKPVTTIHVCQRYFEVSEPWKVYARHGTTNGNYVLVAWDDWHEC